MVNNLEDIIKLSHQARLIPVAAASKIEERATSIWKKDSKNRQDFNMKQLILCLTLVLYSVFAMAKPPFRGTTELSPNIATASDPSAFESISYKGTGSRTMFDRRASDWVILNPFLFEARFDDGRIVEMQVNPEFKNNKTAEVEAKKYAWLIGQLPAVLRKDIQTSWIHKGNNLFGGGNNNILIHTGMALEYEKDGILEEILIHEAAHTSLDSYHSNAKAWLDAQSDDKNFISGYAKEFPGREDIAESFLGYIATIHRSNSIYRGERSKIRKAMPNRIKYFDAQNFDLSQYSDREVYLPPVPETKGFTELSCSEEGKAKSEDSGENVTINIFNNSNSMMQVHWLDWGGKRNLYHEIQPGDTAIQQTAKMHPWLASDGSGNCVAIGNPKADGTWVINN